MNGNRHYRRSGQYFSLAITAFLAVLIASACQGPAITKGSGDKADLKLSFKVLGVSASKSGAAPSKSVSPLLLPSASTLTVSLTPLDSGLPTPSPVTVSIGSSSGAQVVTATMQGVEFGKYTIKAVAASSSGTAQFQRSASIEVSADSMTVKLVLLPAIDSSSPAYDGETSGFPTVNTLPARSMIACLIPASVPQAGYMGQYNISFYGTPPSVGFKFFVQDADGAILESGDVDTLGYISTAETSMEYNLTILPPSSSETYLILFNPSDSDSTNLSVSVQPYYS